MTRHAIVDQGVFESDERLFIVSGSWLRDRVDLETFDKMREVVLKLVPTDEEITAAVQPEIDEIHNQIDFALQQPQYRDQQVALAMITKGFEAVGSIIDSYEREFGRPVPDTVKGSLAIVKGEYMQAVNRPKPLVNLDDVEAQIAQAEALPGGSMAAGVLVGEVLAKLRGFYDDERADSESIRRASALQERARAIIGL